MTKVVAVNGSPYMDKGNTHVILEPFLEGMKEVGADVEIFYTKKLNINPCQGCYICWLKTPGKCFQKDDMQMLHPKLREADIWVLATPVYFGSLPGPMKTLIDRMNPLFEPFIELYYGHCCSFPRQGTKYGKVVLVSCCGYWEMDNFDLLLPHVQYLREFAGALLRPHADALRPMMEMGEPLDDIFEAAKEAGRQLVRDGKMSAETLTTVSRELMPLEMYIATTNEYYQQALEALEKK
jgi:multimeric flavodoxin WrbA